MLRRPDIDWVMVSSMNGLHAEHAIAGHGHDHERMEWIEFDNATNTAHYTTDRGVHLMTDLSEKASA